MIVIIKPTYACNLSCKYCYLSEETKVSTSFDIQFAKDVVMQLKRNLKKGEALTFIWHGGEPLLWGIDNYLEIFNFMKEVLFDVKYKNLIQTNLTLINDDYIELFKEFDVSPGFSLDGPQAIHDKQRTHRNGKGSFDDVMSGIKKCREAGLNVGCIVVATKNHIGKMQLLYNFMKDNGINFKMNPLFIAGEASKFQNDLAITPEDYADLDIELFDLMFYDRNSPIKNSMFVEIASNLISKKTAGCVFGENCQGRYIAISPEGDVFPCGRFCDIDMKQYSYGNLRHKALRDILQIISNSELYKRADFIKQSSCAKCEWFDICHGGCLHDGYLNTGDFKNKTFLCAAYKKIFFHIKQRLEESGLMQKISNNAE